MGKRAAAILIIFLMLPNSHMRGALQRPSAGQGQPKPASPPKSARAITPVILASVAGEAIRSDPVLGKQRVKMLEGNRSLYVDITPFPLEYIGAAGDATIVPLEGEVRLQALRRDLQQYFPNETFWKAPLDDIETAISGLLERSQNKRGTRPISSADLSTENLEKAFGKLQESLVTYAAQQHLSLEQSRSPSPGFLVTVKFESPDVNVRVMPYLAYLMCKQLGISFEGQLRQLSEGSHKMSGKYHYIARWSVGPNGRDEGDFEILDDGDVVVFGRKGSQ